MNCKELAYMLADYIDGSMDPQLREELDAHIAMCEPCMIFTKTFLVASDKTRQLRKEIEYKIPPEVRSRLETFVRAAALKFPEKVNEYREQVERERREKVLRHGDLEMDVERHRVTAAGREVHLTPIEFKILQAFLEAPERAFSRDQLLTAIYPNHEAAVVDRTIDVHVGKLRAKLGDDPSRPRYIATVRGVGYKLI